MSKIFENKEDAIAEINNIEQRRTELCNEILKNMKDIFENLPAVEQNDVTKDTLGFYLVEDFISCVENANTIKNLELEKEKIQDDINDGVYENNNIITRYMLDIKEYENGGFYTYFRDENRRWYFAKLIKNGVDKDKKALYESRIYTLHDNTYRDFNINKLIVVDGEMSESDCNAESLISTINAFVDGAFNVNPDNAYIQSEII